MKRLLVHIIFVLAVFVMLSETRLYSQAQPIIDTIDISGCNTVPDPFFIARDISQGGQNNTELSAIDTNVNYTYTWIFESRPDTTGISFRMNPSVFSKGIHTVTLTVSDEIAGNCRISATRKIRMLSQFDYPSDYAIYEYFNQGCGRLVTSFNFRSSGFLDNNSTITWFFGDGKTSNKVNPIHLYDSVGRFKVFAIKNSDTVRNNSGNTFTIPIEVTAPPDAEFNFFTKEDTSILKGSYDVFFGGRRQLYADTVYNIVWDFYGDSSVTETRTWTAEQSTSPLAYHTYNDSGYFSPKLYMYYFVDGKKCQSVFDTVLLLHDDLLRPPNIPNVVFPNSNSDYKYFGVTSNGTTPLNLKIYSRAGNLIYEETNVNIKWDCITSHGTTLSKGIYYYVIEAKKDSGFKKVGYFHVF